MNDTTTPDTPELSGSPDSSRPDECGTESEIVQLYEAETRRHDRLSSHVNLLMSWTTSAEGNPAYNLDDPGMTSVRREYILNLASALAEMTAIQRRSQLVFLSSEVAG
jgi:hypothetical protein